MKLLALGLALAGALFTTACGRGAGGMSGSDVELALETLKAAPEHGFSAEQFPATRIEEKLRADKDAGAAALREALIHYARAQHGLTIPKSAFPEPWGLKPTDYDAEASLDAALKAGKFKTWLEGQPTPLPAYEAMRKAYIAYLNISAAGGWPTLDAKATPQALHQRLAAEDPQLAEGGDLTAALQRFQVAHGLDATGKLDAATLAELNVPAIARAAQIRANLERLRWLPREEPASRVEVNIAAATMSYFKDGQRLMHMRSASGRPGGDETPMLASDIDGVVLNPPWNVPDGIADEELRPKGAEYLQANNFTEVDGRLVQQPGPDAALGLVKFDFDNPYSVYLHDTPAKAAFNRTSRAVSHGCVRLAQALEFAKVLLSQEPGWSPARVDDVLASAETKHVALKTKTPVRLLYLTAFEEGGRMAFRSDIYGWDRQLLAMLDDPPKAKKTGKKA